MTMVPQFGRGADFDPGFAMTEEQERELRISILMGQGLTRAEAEAEIDGLYLSLIHISEPTRPY